MKLRTTRQRSVSSPDPRRGSRSICTVPGRRTHSTSTRAPVSDRLTTGAALVPSILPSTSPWTATRVRRRRSLRGGFARLTASSGAAATARSSDRDLLVEVDVLDGVEQAHALRHRPLEGLAPGDEAHATRALVDDGGAHRFLEIALARGGAAGVDQARASHVAVRHLVARPVDRVVGGEPVVHRLVDLAVRALLGGEGEVAAVVLRHLLLDDVRLDRDSAVVGLSGEVGRHVEVLLRGLEGGVAQVAPEDGGQAQLVRMLESGSDFE